MSGTSLITFLGACVVGGTHTCFGTNGGKGKEEGGIEGQASLHTLLHTNPNREHAGHGQEAPARGGRGRGRPRGGARGHAGVGLGQDRDLMRVDWW